MGNFFKDTMLLGMLDKPDYKPSTETRMTPLGENLETALYENLKKNLFPENLASRFIGQAKRFEQGRQREWRGQFQGLSAPGTQNVVSGQAIGGGLLSEARARLSGGSEGYGKVGEAKRGFAISRLGNLQNFMNLQSQTPMLKAEADLLSGELKQQQGYETGATIGTILRLAAMGAA